MFVPWQGVDATVRSGPDSYPGVVGRPRCVRRSADPLVRTTDREGLIVLSTPRSRRLGVAAVASIAALSLGLSAPGQASANPQPAGKPAATAVQRHAADKTVTLITGDRIIL